MSSLRFLACAVLMACAVGCQSMWGTTQLAGNQPRPSHDREDPALNDPWVNEAGAIARKEHPPEEVHDPLGLRNFFTSEKAREIERNVGVGN